MHPYRLARIFDVLGHVASSGAPATLSAISRDLDLPVSSTHDLLTALAEIDAVSVVDKRYELGPRAFELGLRISDSVGVRRAAAPHLTHLAEDIGHDAYLAIRSGSRVMYTDRFQSSQRINIEIRLGQPLYLHSTAVGKLFAAHDEQLRALALDGEMPKLTPKTICTREKLQSELNSIKRAGLSVSREESVQGIVGLAAPVWGPGGRMAAAVHVSALKGRLRADQLGDIGRRMNAAAQAAGTDLGAENERRESPPRRRRSDRRAESEVAA